MIDEQFIDVYEYDDGDGDYLHDKQIDDSLE